MNPPTKLKYQNPMGTRLSALRSDASHCTTHRMKKMPCPTKPMAIQMFSVVIGRNNDALKMTLARVGLSIAYTISETTGLHPSHRDEIVEGLEESITHSILRHTMCTWIMSNRYLGYGEPIHQGQGGKETVHAVEKLQPFHDRAPKYF